LELFEAKEVISTMKGTTPLADWLSAAVAVALMLIGAVLLFTGPSAAIGFSLIAVGAALTVMVQVNKRRRHLET
jgi:hypothetical protein